MARWVQLELNPAAGERCLLACAFYHVCALCGEQRAVLRWYEEGGQPRLAGALCPHLAAELAMLNPFDHAAPEQKPKA